MFTEYSNRHLCPIVISLGGERWDTIVRMFDGLSDEFEPPTLFPGVQQKDLRNCYKLLNHAGRAGIIPKGEWDAIKKRGKELYDDNPATWLGLCLGDVPVQERDHPYYGKLHFCVELWRKTKSLPHPQRKVLACALAHLQALSHVSELQSNDNDQDKKYFISEDNVRVVFQRKGIDEDLLPLTSEKSSNHDRIYDKNTVMEYFGWLGSNCNLDFLYEHFIPSRKEEESFPYPLPQDIVEFLPNHALDDKSGPGGTMVWGAFAYYIDKEGIRSIIEELQADVGALIWKGKRMQYYSVKPIDKILPRMLLRHGFETSQIRCRTDVKFVRAPMLKSLLHTQYDEAYCKSTSKQLEYAGKSWEHDIWLTDEEKYVVSYAKKCGEWKYFNQA